MSHYEADLFISKQKRLKQEREVRHISRHLDQIVEVSKDVDLEDYFDPEFSPYDELVVGEEDCFL